MTISITMALQQIGVSATSHTGAQVGFIPTAPTPRRVFSVLKLTISTDLDAGKVVVVAGFQGVDEDGNITTLGRGGSDTTGVALAAALGAVSAKSIPT